MNPQRLVYLLGISLLVCSMVFLGARVWHYREWLVAWQPGIKFWAVGAGATILYGSSQFLLSTAWCQLLADWGSTQLPIHSLHAIYGKTQIAKYLPGNILHYAGRHWMGQRLGLGNLPLFAASALEVLGILTAATLLGLVGMFYHPQLAAVTATIILAIVLVTTGIIAISLPRLATLLSYSLPPRSSRQIISGLVVPFLLYLAFFATIGSIAVLISVVIGIPLSTKNAGMILTGFAIAWISGFLTPGAPGGIGVRESGIILLLSPISGERDALLIATALRLITTCGDLIFFLMTYLLDYDEMAAHR